MPPGYHATLLRERTTGNPIDLYIEKKDVFRINGLNTIDEPDLETVNGYIQSIKTILRIPFIIDHLSYNKEFSLILEILERPDLDPVLLDHFRKGDPVTFLAPTDNAIISFLGAHPQWSVLGGSKKLANLSIRDIQAANGIIHQIDRVLIPERSN
jgi:uncharacterized surface protein with fasciclin (FAS1) repeats